MGKVREFSCASFGLSSRFCLGFAAVGLALNNSAQRSNDPAGSYPDPRAVVAASCALLPE